MIEANDCDKMLKATVKVNLMVELDNNAADPLDKHRTEVQKEFEFMTSYPNISVTIEGHTDSRGSQGCNKTFPNNEQILLQRC